MPLGFLDLLSNRIVPDRNFKKSVKPIYSVVNYGEGYDSRVSVGTNSYREEYQLSFTNRSIDEIDRITGFINEREKYKNFIFTVPDSNEPSGEKDISVYCEGYNRIYVTYETGSVSCKFIRVFEVDSALSVVTILNSSIILDEGVSDVINVSTTQRGAETLYWTLDGATTADFTAVNGSFSTGGSVATASGSFTIETLDDTTTEGGEVYTLSVRADSIGGSVLANKQVQVIDTSRTPPAFNWTNNNGTPITEVTTLKQSTVEIAAKTTNFDNSELLYWNFDTSSGIYFPSLGSLRLVGTFAESLANLSLTSTAITEPKTDIITLRRNSISGPVLDTITILTFPFIGRKLVDSNGIEQLFFRLSDLSSPEYVLDMYCTGVGVPVELLYWTIEGASQGVDFDFVAGSFTPTGTSSINTGTFQLVGVATEDAKSFTINIRTDSVSGPIVASSLIFIANNEIGIFAKSDTTTNQSISQFESTSLLSGSIRWTPIIAGPFSDENITNQSIGISEAASLLSGEVQRQTVLIFSGGLDTTTNQSISQFESTSLLSGSIRWTPIIAGPFSDDNITNQSIGIQESVSVSIITRN
jgi:phage-related protein